MFTRTVPHAVSQAGHAETRSPTGHRMSARFCFTHYRLWDEHVGDDCNDGIDVGRQSTPNEIRADMAMAMAQAMAASRVTRERAQRSVADGVL